MFILENVFPFEKGEVTFKKFITFLKGIFISRKILNFPKDQTHTGKSGKYFQKSNKHKKDISLEQYALFLTFYSWMSIDILKYI